MSPSVSDFLHVMSERGFLHQCTDEAALKAALADGPVTGYIGFDATADSLHAGSLLPIMMLKWLQDTGNRPIVLMGGGTTRIGDPSGKDESRQLLDDARIAENIAGIRSIFDAFLSFGDGPTDAILVNNADWLDPLGYIEMLRKVGPHFTVNRMLTFDSVKLRLDREQPLTFLEFNYMILQAYDFVELHRRFGCRLQMGGSDQWGNIVNGVELGRRTANAGLFGLTAPLLTTSTGAKMGKTAAGAVWLRAERLSPYDYFQYWRNVDDADVGRFLKLFTLLPMDEIRRLDALDGAEINAAKIVLATEATRLLHGAAEAEAARQTAEQTFAGAGMSDGLPTFEIPAADLAAGIGIIDLLRTAELVASNGEARRLIKQGGARVNDTRITDDGWSATADALHDGVLKLSAGKKRHALVKPVG